MRNKGIKDLHLMVFTAMMAAIVFVSTYFIKIDIPTPVGPTMLKSGNIFCLLAGLLLGAVPGGLAAGIGSMLFDLLDPRFASEAWLTFIRFFMMGALAGLISHLGGAQGEKRVRNVAALCVAALFSFLFYIVKSVAVLMLAGSTFEAAFIACTAKMVTAGLNSVIAVVCALLLHLPLKAVLSKSGLMRR